MPFEFNSREITAAGSLPDAATALLLRQETQTIVSTHSENEANAGARRLRKFMMMIEKAPTDAGFPVTTAS